MAAGGQQRSRKKQLHVRFGAEQAGRLLPPHSRSQTWEAPWLQATTSPQGAFAQIRGISHPPGGYSLEWTLGWISVPIHLCLTHLNPGANAVVVGSWGTQELSGAVLFLQGCVAGYRELEV